LTLTDDRLMDATVSAPAEPDQRTADTPADLAESTQTATAVVPNDRVAAAQCSPEQTMVALAFNGCFGWFHPASGESRKDTGIVLCTGLCEDAINAHVHLRLLASEFAASGYPVLRFDYLDCGDSCDIGNTDCWPAEHWAAWQQSIHDAAEQLREISGATSLVFAGLRFGALLAASASVQREDVAGLILLAPVVRGHSYLRQLSVQASLQGKTIKAAESGFEVQRLQLSAETAGLISRADLRRLPMACGRSVAIFGESRGALVTECVEAWRGSGAMVDIVDFAGLEPLLREVTSYEGPPADFTRIRSWLEDRVPGDALVDGPQRLPVERPRLLHPGAVEEPVRFGRDNRLFGMLCRPLMGASDLAVVISAGGRDPHYGWARFAVGFARALAAHGIASLRIDFAGLGDSLADFDAERAFSPVFETDRTPDIRAAIDKLEQLGFRRFAMRGHCATAYHAFHAAAAEPRISTLVLVNLPVAEVTTTNDMEHAHRKVLGIGHYVRQLARPEMWARLLQGRIPLGSILRARIAIIAERLHVAPTPPAPGAPRQLAALLQRGVRTLFLFTENDSGLKVFQQQFRPRDVEGAKVVVIAGGDHALSESATQQVVVQEMVDFVLASEREPT
jgi:alpha/beta superfamily hydrolase